MEKDMDIFESCISTLIYYLEQEGYLEIKNVTEDKCTLKCSGGQSHLDALADKVPIVKTAADVKFNEDTKNGKAACKKQGSISRAESHPKMLIYIT
jgi:hypothetical protein